MSATRNRWSLRASRHHPSSEVFGRCCHGLSMDLTFCIMAAARNLSGILASRHHPSSVVCGRWSHGLPMDLWVLYNGHVKEPLGNTGVPSPSVIGGVRALVPRPVDGSRVLYNGHGKEPLGHTGSRHHPSSEVFGRWYRGLPMDL